MSSKWLKELRENEKTSDIPILLVGTKSDLFDAEEFIKIEERDEEEEEEFEVEKKAVT